MQKGYSQKELSAIAKINRTQYNRYENGETMPSTETIAKIADVLGVSVDYLLEGDEEDAAIANFEDKDLLQLFSEVEKMQSDDKVFIKKVLADLVKVRKFEQLQTG